MIVPDWRVTEEWRWEDEEVFSAAILAVGDATLALELKVLFEVDTMHRIDRRFKVVLEFMQSLFDRRLTEQLLLIALFVSSSNSRHFINVGELIHVSCTCFKRCCFCMELESLCHKPRDIL